MTRHLIREGTPTLDLSELVQATGAPPAQPVAGEVPQIREVSRYSGVTVVDHADGRLRAAVGAARAVPSLATHLAAAGEYRRLGILDQAFAELQKGALIDEHDAAVNDALARTWRDVGMPGMGLSNAYRAVYAAPRSAAARNTLGTLLDKLGRPADAERSFREAVGLDPAAWYAWQNLCTLAMTGGRTQEAIALCHRASTLKRDAQKANQP